MRRTVKLNRIVRCLNFIPWQCPQASEQGATKTSDNDSRYDAEESTPPNIWTTVMQEMFEKTRKRSQAHLLKSDLVIAVQDIKIFPLHIAVGPPVSSSVPDIVRLAGRTLRKNEHTNLIDRYSLARENASLS